MRKVIVAGNWKMNTDINSGKELAENLNNIIAKKGKKNNVGVIIAPPFTHLYEISKVIDNEQICLAAQNCATEEKGAYTGEVSAEMLKAVGCKAVIIGHSERRAYYNEDDEMLLKKVKIVLSNKMKAIFCCGETLEERKAGKHFDLVKSQLNGAILKLGVSDFENIIVAYEPVWAIGTGETATPEQAQEMHAFIRKTVEEKLGNEVSENLKILYGGSVKASNSGELFSQKDIDGGLVGGASLDAEEFYKIIESV